MIALSCDLDNFRLFERIKIALLTFWTSFRRSEKGVYVLVLNDIDSVSLVKYILNQWRVEWYYACM